MSRRRQTPVPTVAVVGGGPAGLSAALALARAGVRVALVDGADAGAADGRTSALMLPAIEMLRRLDVWEACEKVAAPLRRMRLVDDTGRLIRAPSVTFDAAEIGEPAFGWNIPNVALLAALRERADAQDGLRWIRQRAATVSVGDDRVKITLADGEAIEVEAAIAADGRNSQCRAAAGIEVDTHAYEQAAIVASVRHTIAHGDASTEFHRPAGPFTLVPLPGNRSSLVWVEGKRSAEALALFDDATTAREIEKLSHRLLGSIQVDGPRQVFPLSALVARRLAANRVVLVGEAGHVLPPIGAQGLNLGLRDAASAAEIVADAVAAGMDPGQRAVTERYESARRLDVSLRSRAVDAMNRSLLSDMLPVQALRAAGLTALGRFAPLRRAAMREGIAPAFALPALMRRN